jgi:ribosomal protein S9
VLLVNSPIYASLISGTIRQKNGQPLAFASVLIKGNSKGTTANSKGFYSLNLESGTYVLVVKHIGYQSIEKSIKVISVDQVLDFEMQEQHYDLKEVIVTSGGEDPAYAIIRNAIAKRLVHLNEIKRFECDVYLKGQLQLRDFPKKFMGKSVDFEDGDTSKRKMIFLSESVAKYSFEEPNKKKIDVISTKLSGKSDGFGFGNPQIISFYENIISIGRSLNPRGFISPIASSALNFYRYKFEGSFFENGKEFSRIKVIPKRKYEPLFSGYITIVENDWRIQSLQLTLVKEQQMQLVDTLVIEQLYVPIDKKNWVIKSQVIYPSGKFFGFNFFGNFLQVYDHFNINPIFLKNFFNNTIIKYEDSSNKKSMAYWDSIRPLPLLIEERRDYFKKDSLEQVQKSPVYLDSLDRIRNKLKLSNFIFTGKTISIQKRKETINFRSLLSSFFYNTVEGGVLNLTPNYTKRYIGRQSISISPTIRYGFGNNHLNTSLGINYNYGKNYPKSLNISGGKNVFQFNNNQPITPTLNSIVTLTYTNNYLKIYEAAFFKFGCNTGLSNGVSVGFDFQFQNRQPLNNLPDLPSWKTYPNRLYTPNYPTEISSSNMLANKASIVNLRMSWRPGSKYIELPNQKRNIGSKYPIFSLIITKGIEGLLGSNVSYTKWQFSMNDNLNLKLAGRLNYNITFSGFLNSNKVFIPDYQHYQGNQLILSTPFLNSFQLAPYYQYSNTEKLNISAHIEYHLNGLLTNKIPVFKKYNWFFVTGVNALQYAPESNYTETYFGIENILKVIRLDLIQGFAPNGNNTNGVRLTLPLFN